MNFRHHISLTQPARSLRKETLPTECHCSFRSNFGGKQSKSQLPWTVIQNKEGGMYSQIRSSIHLVSAIISCYHILLDGFISMFGRK